MSSPKRIWFVVNPNSGVKSKEATISSLEKHLDPNIDYKVILTERAAHATEISKQAVEQGIDAVVAVGGDGTVNEVGQALLHTDVALGIIPAGSGNGFARHLGIPMNTRTAIEKINQFNTQRIDTAKLNDESFLATAGLGFDAHVGWKFANFGRRGFISYMQVTTQEFFNFKPQKYVLEIDGKKIETRAFLINFANAGQYGNNAWIAPSASLSDGLLNVCILEQFPAHFVPDIIFKLFSKTIEKSRYYKVYQAKEIRVIKVDQFHIDGEPKEGKTDLLIKVVPLSLKVII